MPCPRLAHAAHASEFYRSSRGSLISRFYPTLLLVVGIPVRIHFAAGWPSVLVLALFTTTPQLYQWYLLHLSLCFYVVSPDALCAR